MRQEKSTSIDFPMIGYDADRFPQPVIDGLKQIVFYLVENGIVRHTTPGSDGDDEKVYIIRYIVNAHEDAAKSLAESGEAVTKEFALNAFDLKLWSGKQRRVQKIDKNYFLLKVIEDFIAEYYDENDGRLVAFLDDLRKELAAGDLADGPLPETERARLQSLLSEVVPIEVGVPHTDPNTAEGIEDPALTSGATKTRSALTQSLESFLRIADNVLLFPPFSLQALSIHFCFAAFYAFVAMALVWGLSSALDLGGEVALLPSGSEAATTGREFDGESVSNNRFFVLSAVLVVVLIVVVGLIAAYTAVTSTLAQKVADWVRARSDSLAISAVLVSSIAIALSGMDVRFALLFFAIMVVCVLLAGRMDRRQLLAISFPFAFIFSIVCIATLGNLWGPLSAAGGVLPVLAFLSLLIGSAAQPVKSTPAKTPTKDGTLVAAGVVLLCSLLLAALNYLVFDGWFRIDPWDPGTVVVLLILPVANGIWDYFSASITRKLSQWALTVTKAMDDKKAVLAYVGFVLVDVILAFGTIILLYLCLFTFLATYNMVAFPNSEGVSLNAFFEGFRESLFSASGVLVVIMLVTVLVPTLIHVHMVSRTMMRSGGVVGMVSALGYLVAITGSLALLLNAARGILYFLVPELPA
ncbi:MAG: hypothetical protein AAF636_22300 [Pseudomonadota bacterium]